MKKESILTKEGFFGCDVFQSSVLEVAKKYIIAESSFYGSGGTAAFFPEEVWSSSGRKKQVDRFSSTFKKEVEDFSQRLGKTGWFLSLSSKADWHSQWQRETIFMRFFFQMCRRLKLFTVVSDKAFSILPMIFLSCPSWRRYCRGLRRLPEIFFFLGKDQRTVTVTKF